MPALLHRVTMPRPDDPDIIKPFCAAIAQGHPVATAATLAGISERAAHEWIQLGTEALNAEDGVTESNAAVLGSHAQFALATKMAEADFVAENLHYVRSARGDDKGWLPAMTLLERRQPNAFGRFQRIEVESKSVVINLTGSLPPGAAEALHAIAQAEIERKALTAGDTTIAADSGKGPSESLSSPRG